MAIRKFSVPADREGPGEVYIIRVARCYKIGLSLDAEKRVGSFNFPDVYTVRVFKTDKRRELERTFHVAFASQRRPGRRREWFDLAHWQLAILLALAGELRSVDGSFDHVAAAFRRFTP